MSDTNNTPPQAFGPYSPVRQVGNTYYVSGQVGVDPKTRIASDDLETQVRQALKNLGTALSSVGLVHDNVVKTTLFVTDMSAFVTVNEIYVSYFNEPRPARSTVGVAELPRIGGDTKILFEIEAVAVRESS
jgi:2-iminobutanoate/2-iminopropanoate deaminase